MGSSVVTRVREWAQKVRLAFRSLQTAQLASALAGGIVFGLVPVPGERTRCSQRAGERVSGKDEKARRKERGERQRCERSRAARSKRGKGKKREARESKREPV